MGRSLREDDECLESGDGTIAEPGEARLAGLECGTEIRQACQSPEGRLGLAEEADGPIGAVPALEVVGNLVEVVDRGRVSVDVAGHDGEGLSV
jgi:hypothetical protein